MNDELLKIGRVVEVDGASVTGELEVAVGDLYRTYKSRRYAIGQVGSIVKIESGDDLIFGILTRLRMAEMPHDQEPTSFRVDVAASKWIEIQLLGQGRRNSLAHADFEFERGVSSYPLPGQPIHLASIEELRRVYQKPKKPTIRVGSLAQASGLPVHVMIDELLGKHFAVLGTTGSGKSCALALLLQSILSEYPHAHIILLDPHNEYSKQTVFADQADRIDLTVLELPHWLLNHEEACRLFLGKSPDQATVLAAILHEAILSCRRKFIEGKGNAKALTVDSPVPYRIGDVLAYLIEHEPKDGGKPAKEPYQKTSARIQALRDDKRFEFLMRPDDGLTDNLSSLLSKLFRIPDDQKPIALIDLSGVPSDVIDLVVSLLCRIIFDFAVWNLARRDTPLLLVCEEAHRYAPRSERVEFHAARQSLSRIAKEGRKDGVSLALVTQRPSELSETILSQCNTIIALRMGNEQDQAFVAKALPDSVRSLVDALPALRTREAMIVGEGCSVPVRFLFDELDEDRQPHSSEAPFSTSWKSVPGSTEIVSEAVRRWREQDRSTTEHGRAIAHPQARTPGQKAAE